jgi:hypothetical protein
MQRVRASAADFRAALDFGYEKAPESAARLVAALYWPWFIDGHLRELQGWAEAALNARLSDPGLRGRLWWAVSAARIARGDLDGSETAARAQIEAGRAARHRDLEALGFSLLGMAGWARGDLAQSARHHARGIERAADGDPWVAALVHALAGRVAHGSPEGVGLLAEAEALAQRTGEPMVIASCQDYAGAAALAAGDPKAAMDLAARALSGYEAVGYQEGIASAHALAGAAAAASADWFAARHHFEFALDTCRRLQHRGGVATAWDGLGIVAAHTGRLEEAAGLLSMADAERARIGAAVAPHLAELRHAALNLIEHARTERPS